MPIYEYQCEACGHQFDIIQKISDDKLTLCPKCNEHKLKKLVTAAGFKLKKLPRKKLKLNQLI